jgi:acyl-CoA thioester hydrolase
MPHTFTAQIRYGDLDTQGHVNHVAQMQIIEASRAVLFELAALSPWNPGQAVRRLEVEYLAPIPPEQKVVVVEMSCSAIGRTSYTLKYRLVSESGTLHSKCTTVMISLDGEGRPSAVTAPLRAALESMAS